jgi:hypothetical protein
MSAGKRRPIVAAEATQELQAADVLEVLGTRGSAADLIEPPAGRKRLTSEASIAPVGLDLARGLTAREEEINPTMQVRLPRRRRRLGKVVVATVGACALILIAAAVARVGRASDEPSSPAKMAATAPIATPNAARLATTSPGPLASPGPTAPGSPSSTGTVRLDGHATAAHVWLDGKKLAPGSSSVLLSCGTHKIRIGHGRAHSIDVPCGGEVGVSR